MTRAKPAPAPRLLYSKVEAAAQLSISQRVLDRLIADGVIETVPIGRRRLIPHDVLTDYVAKLRAMA